MKPVKHSMDVFGIRNLAVLTALVFAAAPVMAQGSKWIKSGSYKKYNRFGKPFSRAATPSHIRRLLHRKPDLAIEAIRTSRADCSANDGEGKVVPLPCSFYVYVRNRGNGFSRAGFLRVTFRGLALAAGTYNNTHWQIKVRVRELRPGQRARISVSRWGVVHGRRRILQWDKSRLFFEVYPSRFTGDSNFRNNYRYWPR